MNKNKDIIWQMSRDYKPENKTEYICGFDDYLPQQPINFWNKIKTHIQLSRLKKAGKKR